MPTSRASPRPKGRPRGFAWLLLSLPAAVPSAAWAGDAWTEQERAPTNLLALEVELNGRPTRLIATFAEAPDGELATTPEELDALGFDTSRLPPPRNGLIALRELPGLSYRYDPAVQRVALISPPELLKMQRLASASAPPRLEVAPSATGMVVNYTLVGSGARDDASGRLARLNGGAQLEARLFGAFGLVSSSMAATTHSPARAGAVRLDTNWTWEDPGHLTAVNAGDLISSGLSWTRPIRMGGVQVSRSFSLRPDILTRPVPVLRGTAQAPSTLDLFIDGAQVLSSQVPAGPFEVSPGPPRAGAGHAEVVVRDLLGRESRLEVPFYASDSLLARGLFDFGVELGFARRNYGIRSNDYDGRLALSGSVRYGLSDRLTLHAHGEATRGLQLLGAGAAVDIESVAIASVALSGSRSMEGAGGNLDVGLESRHGSLSASLRAVRAFGAYHDLASVTAEDRRLNGFDSRRLSPPKRVEQAQIASSLWSRAQLSVSYARVEREDQRAKLAVVSLSQGFSGVTAYLRGWNDFSENRSGGLTFGLSLALGPRLFSASELALTGRRLSGVSEMASQSSGEPGSFSWRTRVAEGELSDRLAGVTYVSPFGRVEAGLQQTGGRATAFVQAAGALALADGNLFASRRVDGAFAIVDAGAPDVPVLFENRSVGRTGRGGRLLIPDLLPYQSNRIAFDSRFLPLDQHVEKEEFLVVPRRGAGATVRLPVARGSSAALITFVDGSGRPLRPGAGGRIQGIGTDFMIGYDGESYVPDLSPENVVIIEDSNGRRCEATFRFSPKANNQVRLGPVACLPLQMARGEPDGRRASADLAAEPVHQLTSR
jgi:outer membrane usher protein